jgi:hypothetical protein
VAIICGHFVRYRIRYASNLVKQSISVCFTTFFRR